MKKVLLLLAICVLVYSSADAALIQVKLTVSSSQGIGSVMVFNQTAGTPGINCSGTNPCSFTFKSGTSVVITANSSSAGFAFHGWRNTAGSATACASQPQNSCAFTITADSTAIAKFDEIFGVHVQVAQGTGTIHVTDNAGSPPIDCTNAPPLECSRSYFKGVKITVQSNAGANQQFGSYASKTGSAATCGGNPCSFVLTDTTKLFTNFIQIP